ncbi:MAG: glycosyltransferase [Candidatus Nanopelagicales bacterium]
MGQVLGTVDPSTALWIELRGEAETTRVPVGGLRRDAVPEEVFAGLEMTRPPTPASLAPVVGVVRASPILRVSPATVTYRHRSITGTAPVSVVVPVHGNFTYLRNLMRALADGLDGIELTIVVDDPDLTYELTAWVRAWNDSVFDLPMQVLAHERNAGFASACNSGWRSTASEVVLLLNSDVLVGSAEYQVRRLAAGLTRGVAAVAPVLLFPDGTLQHAGMEMVDAPDFPGFVLPSHPGKHGQAGGLPVEPFSVQMLTGAAFCVRRSDLEAIGGVPSVFGRGDFEDVLMSVALRARGRLVVDPGVRWTHVEGASYRRDDLGGVAVTLAKSVVAGERVVAIEGAGTAR